MGWLGLDDTDSLNGGCTTEVFHRLLEELPEEAKVGTPRLVRLWPFAQRRTRGNAAVGVEIHSNDEPALLNHLDRWWKAHILPLTGEVQESTVSDRVQSPASPGMVWFSVAPDEAIYWATVRGEVAEDDLPTPLRRWGGHGCIGATAAVAWPASTVTWEAIAWRQTDATGPRLLDENALVMLDAWPEVVFSRDPRRGKQLVAPRGRSPVLFGLRTLSEASAKRACRTLLEAGDTEPAAGWRVFQTNQASGDHLDRSITGDVSAVEVDPVRKHATLTVSEETMIHVFAESGPVNALARWLIPGDQIEVRGLRHPDGSVHAEQMRLVKSVARTHLRPVCPSCGRRMKSMGAGQGVRCPVCKLRGGDDWIAVEANPPYDDWVEPEIDGRRHLARPLEWAKNH